MNENVDINTACESISADIKTSAKYSKLNEMQYKSND
jgi:hypothetical protein